MLHDSDQFVSCVVHAREDASSESVDLTCNVSMTFPDGVTRVVPSETISRSAVVREVVDLEGGQVKLFAPDRVRKWLDCVTALTEAQGLESLSSDTLGGYLKVR